MIRRPPRSTRTDTSVPTRRSSDLPVSVTKHALCLPGDRLTMFETPSPLAANRWRSEEHTSELQSLMRISYAVFCFKKNIYTSTIVNVPPTHILTQTRIIPLASQRRTIQTSHNNTDNAVTQ